MTTFTTLFKNNLMELLENEFPGFCSKEEIEYAGGEFKIKFDGYIERNDKIVVIELEFRRADPINNLIKTIHWLTHSIRKKKVKMVQLYDQNYYSRPQNRYKKEFTLFLAKRSFLLHKKLSSFRYFSLDLNVDERAFRRKDEKIAKKLATETYKKIIEMI